VKAYRDFKELLADQTLDAVLIATPVYLHPEHFEAAVAAKKHIYCEKPAGADVAGVKRLLAASKRADPAKVIQFGFQQRFSPEYLAAEKRLLSGEMGDLTLMMSYWVWGGNAFRSVPPSPYPEQERMVRHWGANKSTSGDFIVEQDCHGLDVLNWFARAFRLPRWAWRTQGAPSATTPTTRTSSSIQRSRAGCSARSCRRTLLGCEGAVLRHEGMVKPPQLPWLRWARGRRQVRLRARITIDAIEHFYSAIIEAPLDVEASPARRFPLLRDGVKRAR
jgi:hypothetical protein